MQDLIATDRPCTQKNNRPISQTCFSGKPTKKIVPGDNERHLKNKAIIMHSQHVLSCALILNFHLSS